MSEPIWTCPTCNKGMAYHARRAEYLMQTEGPRAVLEFEREHPEPNPDESRIEAILDDEMDLN